MRIDADQYVSSTVIDMSDLDERVRLVSVEPVPNGERLTLEIKGRGQGTVVVPHYTVGEVIRIGRRRAVVTSVSNKPGGIVEFHMLSRWERFRRWLKG